MRSPTIAAFRLSLLLSTLTTAHPSDLSPFILALPELEAPLHSQNDTLSASDASEGSFDLVRRQFCPSDYSSCSTISAPGACCSTDTICTLDNAGNAACCPLGSFCTGTISILAISPDTATAAAPPNLVTTSTASNGAVVIISNPNPTTTVPPTTTGVPATTATVSQTAASPTPTLVSNPYFPFPYIPTTFANSADCAAAYAGCTSNFAQCTADLQGGAGAGFGVTVAVPGGGGVTVAPGLSTSLSPASATSVCQSLSVQACPGSAATCAAYGGAAGGSTAGGSTAGGGAGGGGAVVTTTVVAGSGAERVLGREWWVIGVTFSAMGWGLS